MPQVTGKFIKMFPLVEGEKDGRFWVRGQFTIMTMDSNAKLLGFDMFGDDKVNMVKSLQVGQTVIVDYFPESREFNDRVYTNLQCHRVMVAQRLESAQTPNSVSNDKPSAQ